MKSRTTLDLEKHCQLLVQRALADFERGKQAAHQVLNSSGELNRRSKLTPTMTATRPPLSGIEANIAAVPAGSKNKMLLNPVAKKDAQSAGGVASKQPTASSSQKSSTISVTSQQSSVVFCAASPAAASLVKRKNEEPHYEVLSSDSESAVKASGRVQQRKKKTAESADK